VVSTALLGVILGMRVENFATQDIPLNYKRCCVDMRTAGCFGSTGIRKADFGAHGLQSTDSNYEHGYSKDARL
jgi:hypothetical protein